LSVYKAFPTFPSLIECYKFTEFTTFCSQLEYKRTEDRRSNSHGGVELTPLHRITFCSASGGSEHPQNDPSSNSTKTFFFCGWVAKKSSYIFSTKFLLSP